MYSFDVRLPFSITILYNVEQMFHLWLIYIIKSLWTIILSRGLHKITSIREPHHNWNKKKLIIAKSIEHFATNNVLHKHIKFHESIRTMKLDIHVPYIVMHYNWLCICLLYFNYYRICNSICSDT